MDNKYFKIEKNALKRKKFIFTPFIKVLNDGFIDGQFREYVYADFISKYYKFKDYNVFYAPGFDSFTFNSFLESKVSYNELSDNLGEKYLSELNSLGINYDQDKLLNFRDKQTTKNIQKLFLYFYHKGLIKYKEKNVYVNYDRTKIYDGIETDNKIKTKQMPCFVLDIEKFTHKFVSNVNKLLIDDSIKEEMINKLLLSRSLTINFYCDNNYSFEYELKKPEMLGALSALIINPNYVDIFNFISPDIIFAVENFLSNKDLPYLDTNVSLTNPLTGAKVKILLSFKYECDYKLIYNDDYSALDYFNLDYIQNIKDGKMINSDFLDGFTVEKAHDLIIDTFTSEGLGKENICYDKKEILITSLNKFGMPFPLMSDGESIITLDKHLPIYFSSQFRRIIPNEQKIDMRYKLFDITLNSLFTRGISLLLQIISDNKIDVENLLSNDNINYLHDWLIRPLLIINRNYLSYDLFMPLMFLTIIEQLEDVKLINHFEIKFSESLYDLYGNKILKDSNNCLNLEELERIYYPDSLRLFVLENDLDKKIYFSSDKLFKYKTLLTEIEMFYEKDFVLNQVELDFEFYKFKNKVYDYLTDFDTKNIISLIFNFFDFIKDKKISKKQALDFLVILYLFAPNISEKIYNKINKKDNILNYEWPI